MHASWSAYFSNMEQGIESEHSFLAPPSIGGSVGRPSGAPAVHAGGAVSSDELGLSYLIREFMAFLPEPAFRKGFFGFFSYSSTGCSSVIRDGKGLEPKGVSFLAGGRMDGADLLRSNSFCSLS